MALVDLTNFDKLLPEIMESIRLAKEIGFDLETFDRPHAALAAFCKARKKLIFDINRTQIAGFSIFGTESYYFNIYHQDEENRLTFDQIKPILNAITQPDKMVIAHNSVFEMTMVKKVWNYDLNRNKNVVCTMIMAATAYNPDTYKKEAFQAQRIEPLTPLLPQIDYLFTPKRYSFFEEPEVEVLNDRQNKLIQKVVGKSSRAAFSYNGLVDNIAFTYGLKTMVERFFGHKMNTFKETLGQAKDMGELTASATTTYGIEDSFWAVKIYKYLFELMQNENPKALVTFFSQENPMAAHYSQMWCNGIVIDKDKILKSIEQERVAMAQVLRKLKKALKEALPFKESFSQTLYDAHKIYRNGYIKYRDAIKNFTLQPDQENDYLMCRQVRSAITNSWAKERGDTEIKGLNLNYYITMQTILYDLLNLPPQYGITDKITADKDARKFLESQYSDVPVIQALSDLSGIEQRMSLYLNPYMQLIDPDTNKIYPSISSELATRRMAMKNPNGMQLAKRGASAYIREFYLPDNKDHLIVALDWSQVELVLIGELSGDPEFAACYKRTPYKDLHSVAAAPLASIMDGVQYTLEQFKALDPDTYEEHRTLLGKAANFEYWYSGGLWNMGSKLNLSPTQIKGLSERYVETFPVAEIWRRATIQDIAINGHVELPDGTRRIRFESTPLWKAMMTTFFNGGSEGLKEFGGHVIRKIQTRSGNQGVNALIQGSCATLAKRTAERTIRNCKLDVRFMMPIHDELVWSVHYKDVPEFIPLAKKYMLEHSDIISNLTLDCTASIGNSFRSYDKEQAPYGQIKLGDLPSGLFKTPPDKDKEVETVIDYLRY